MFFRIMTMHLFITILLGMNVYGMTEDGTASANVSLSKVRRLPQSASFSTDVNAMDSDGEGDEPELKELEVDCSCNYKEKERDKKEEVVVFEKGAKFSSILYRSVKDLIGLIKEGTSTQYGFYLDKVIKNLVDQKKCLKCLTISLHEVVNNCVDQKMAINIAKKLIFFGAVINSNVRSGDTWDHDTPVDLAQRRRFNKLALFLKEAMKE